MITLHKTKKMLKERREASDELKDMSESYFVDALREFQELIFSLTCYKFDPDAYQRMREIMRNFKSENFDPAFEIRLSRCPFETRL
ncbi:MAG: hypothetical protein [Caudoviricetes sp.]|nr:MAG: hypothetical protein [Caudoviricetes sp.]